MRISGLIGTSSVVAVRRGDDASTRDAKRAVGDIAPFDFIKALIAAARAKNVTVSHHGRNIFEKSTTAKVTGE